jgi:hypothetical protein
MFVVGVFTFTARVSIITQWGNIIVEVAVTMGNGTNKCIVAV